MTIEALIIYRELVVPIAKPPKVEQMLVYINLKRLLEYLPDPVLLLLDTSTLQERAEELLLLVSAESLPLGVAARFTASNFLHVIWVALVFLFTVHHLDVVSESQSLWLRLLIFLPV
jgi:hypothetical protein